MLELEGTYAKRSRLHIDDKPHSMQQSPLIRFKTRKNTSELGPKDTINTLGKVIFLGGPGQSSGCTVEQARFLCDDLYDAINTIINHYLTKC